MSKLTMTKRAADRGIAIIDLSGDITLGGGNIFLKQTLRSLAEQNEKKVLLNLSNVTYIDSSGLGELVAGYTSVSKSGGELKLLNLTDRVKDLMMITKLLTVFDAYDDEATAIAAFKTDADDYTTGQLDATFVQADGAR
ncbi:MAG TPA: STAS domain-containing protein [Pyrinomonadaceae bacterium]|jgi:anti-sigma B factor antagonist|nr:STAS domain-containing protein [Pyrinomonadaceae bacterium]